MLLGRLDPVAPPDHHGRLADLALGDPADLVLVKPRRDPLGPAQHAIRRHSQYLLAVGSSSAGNTGRISSPARASITSSSVRAAGGPSGAGPQGSATNSITPRTATGAWHQVSL